MYCPWPSGVYINGVGLPVDGSWTHCPRSIPKSKKGGRDRGRPSAFLVLQGHLIITGLLLLPVAVIRRKV